MTEVEESERGGEVSGAGVGNPRHQFGGALFGIVGKVFGIVKVKPW